MAKNVIQLKRGTLARWEELNPILAAGEIGFVKDKNKIKIGDGTKHFKDLPYIGGEGGGSCTVYQANSYEELPQTGVSQGDIGIVTTVIYGDKKSKTAYVYDSTNGWIAMDGNYSASNVYFDSNLTITHAFGKYTIPSSGSTTVPSAGMNLKSVLLDAFSERVQPSKSDPVASFSSQGNFTAYEAGTKVSPSYAVSLSAGSYTYGPATGVVATAYSTTFNGETKTTQSGSFSEVQVSDKTNLAATTTITHNEGAIAKDNLGDNSNPILRIAAGTKTKTSNYITGYRKMFYGTMTTKPDTMTSANIRALVGSEKEAAKSSNSLKVTIPIGAYRVIIAVPKGTSADGKVYSRSVTSIKDKNGLGAEIFSSFTKVNVDVYGMNNFDAINYDVYYLNYANANDKVNEYQVTIV